VIRYTSHPNVQSQGNATLVNYSNKDPPETVFIDFQAFNVTQSHIVKYDLDKIVQSKDQEAQLEKTVSIDSTMYH